MRKQQTDKEKLLALGEWLRVRGYSVECKTHDVGMVQFDGKPLPTVLRFYLDNIFNSKYMTFAMGNEWKVAVAGDWLRWELNGENLTKPNIDMIVRLFKKRAVVTKPKTEAQLKQEKIARLEEQLANLEAQQV